MLDLLRLGKETINICLETDDEQEVEVELNDGGQRATQQHQKSDHISLFFPPSTSN